MTLKHKKRLALSLCVLSAMLVCAFFSFRHSAHQAAFHLAFWVLFLITSWLNYKYNLERRQPDTLIHLFPAPPDTKERS